MSQLTLFGNQDQSALALLNGIEDGLSSTLSGSTGVTNRRISMKGNAWRTYINGKEVKVKEERTLNAVIIDAAPLNRMLFPPYKEGEVSKPICWSSDTQKPDASVPAETRQANRCMDCSQNIKSSGQGESRACRFQQRIAVMLEGELDRGEVYQLTLPATSIFGDGERGKWPLQAYGRHLKAHNTHAMSIVTEMRLDINSPTPKVTFNHSRALTAPEIQACVDMKNHADTVRAITLNVSQFDAGLKSTKEEFAPASASIVAQKATPVVEVVEAEIEEPKVVVKKTTAAPTSTVEDLGVVISDWDDE
jgi:hypothetical protein